MNYIIIQYLWIILGLILVIYTIYIDIIIDWGFFEKNCPKSITIYYIWINYFFKKKEYLRSKLAFESNQNFYYIIIVLNFILRFNWLFAISPNIYHLVK